MKGDTHSPILQSTAVYLRTEVRRRRIDIPLAKADLGSFLVILAGGLIDSNYGGRLAISTSTALAPPGAQGPYCHSIQLLLRL